MKFRLIRDDEGTIIFKNKRYRIEVLKWSKI